jgi:hypothetical protein
MRIIWHYGTAEPVVVPLGVVVPPAGGSGRVPLSAPDEIVIDILSSDGLRTYDVHRFPDGRWWCPCKDFQHRGETRDCKHIVQAKRRLAGENV